MTEPEPETELSAFSSDDAIPTEWGKGRRELQDAEVYWLSTVRPDGRPHVTPLLGIWLDGALYFCTGPDERKAKNRLDGRPTILVRSRWASATAGSSARRPAASPARRAEGPTPAAGPGG